MRATRTVSAQRRLRPLAPLYCGAFFIYVAKPFKFFNNLIALNEKECEHLLA